MAILCLGAWLVMRGPDFTIGMLVAFQMFAARVSQPMLRLVGLWQQFQQAAIAVTTAGRHHERSARAVDARAARASRSAAAASSSAASSFRYATDRPDVSARLQPAHRARRMRRAHGAVRVRQEHADASCCRGSVWPTAGQVLVDGRDTRHLSANELRADFGVVPQETMLFCGTHPRQSAARQSAGELRDGRPGSQARRDPRHDRSAARRVTRPTSANAASACRAGRSSASPSRVRC